MRHLPVTGKNSFCRQEEFLSEPDNGIDDERGIDFMPSLPGPSGDLFFSSKCCLLPAKGGIMFM
jgi:hypothetical protein